MYSKIYLMEIKAKGFCPFIFILPGRKMSCWYVHLPCCHWKTEKAEECNVIYANHLQMDQAPLGTARGRLSYVGNKEGTVFKNQMSWVQWYTLIRPATWEARAGRS